MENESFLADSLNAAADSSFTKSATAAENDFVDISAGPKGGDFKIWYYFKETIFYLHKNPFHKEKYWLNLKMLYKNTTKKNCIFCLFLILNHRSSCQTDTASPRIWWPRPVTGPTATPPRWSRSTDRHRRTHRPPRGPRHPCHRNERSPLLRYTS